MRQLVIVLLSLCACVGPEGPEGPPGPAGMNGGDGSSTTTQTPDLFESGERIKARATVTEYTTADGASRTVTNFAGWFDKVRSDACSPMRASDGVYRCLPAAATASATYADANCTVPLVAVPISGCMPTPPKYIAKYPTPTCPPSEAGPQLFLVGDTVTEYYVMSESSCTGPTTNTSTFYAYYAATGAEIPPTAFAEMTVTTTTTP